MSLETGLHCPSAAAARSAAAGMEACVRQLHTRDHALAGDSSCPWHSGLIDFSYNVWGMPVPYSFGVVDFVAVGTLAWDVYRSCATTSVTATVRY